MRSIPLRPRPAGSGYASRLPFLTFAMLFAPSNRARALCTAAGVSLIVLTTRAAASPIEPCRPTVVCTVKVEELPAVLLASGGYTLSVSGQVDIPLPSSGQADIAISEAVTVRLSGTTYHGAVAIDPAQCGGDDVHVIE